MNQLQTNSQSFGYCSNEFQWNRGMSPVMYVREGRRLVGDYVMTDSNIVSTLNCPYPIAVGGYPDDGHQVYMFAKTGNQFQGGNKTYTEGNLSIIHSPTVAYGIDLHSIVPSTNQCANLIVTCCPSESHIAFCSTRIECTYAQIGAAAGVIASLSISNNCAVQNVPYNQVTNTLALSGQTY